MPVTVSNRNLGPRSDPQDIRRLREQSYDYHDQLGQPVILKHRWNERDYRNGLVRQCPFHNELYDSDLETCPYCFGTGYLGGYADGILTFATLADAKVDTFRLTDQGLMIHDTSPQVAFPWQPVIGDNDLLITIELDMDTKEVADTYERFTLRQATPVTIRTPGYKNTFKSRPYIVSQQAQVDTVPYSSILFEVPIVFNYDDVPPTPSPVPLPPGYSYTEYDQSIRITGVEGGFETDAELDARVAVAGTNTETETGVRIKGAPGGTHVYID